MTWTPVCKMPIEYRPEDIEQMEIQLELLKRLEDNPENFLPLFHPRFAHWSWWSGVLLDKIGKLVKKEAIKEIARVERDLQYAKEQIGGNNHE
jgi:hypothetical protein